MNTKVSNLKIGNFLSRVSYMRVVRVGLASIGVANEASKEWTISSDVVEAECCDPHNFTNTVEGNRTKIIDVFVNVVKDHAFTVCFNKQPKVEDAYEEVANKGKIKSNAAIKKALKEKMKGEERVLVGYVLDRDINLGRTRVIDLEVAEKDKIRLVDHRTINWLIYRGTKYIVV